MDLASHFRSLFTYDAWANREVLRALRNLTSPPEKSVKVVAHIVATEWLWLNRLRREQQRLAVWPNFTVEQSASQFEPLPGVWSTYLDENLSRLDERFEYTNSKGERWTSTVHDVLTHVVIHSGYHRGQIATDMRGSGFEPAYTDYIHATRQGLV